MTRNMFIRVEEKQLFGTASMTASGVAAAAWDNGQGGEESKHVFSKCLTSRVGISKRGGGHACTCVCVRKREAWRDAEGQAQSHNGGH